ncbi:MAG: hypothetical protein HYR55_19990 [Acidobacteria bacterium]|nr:hypothetical protein [Acidobacteriota bacterium]
MQCGAARKHLYGWEAPSYAEESRLVPAEVAEARAHVAGCAACQEFFAAERRLTDFVRARAPQEKASATLRQRVLARIAEARRPATSMPYGLGQLRRRNWMLAMIGSLVVSVMLGGVWLSQRPARITPQQLVTILVEDHARTSPNRAEFTSSDREAVQKWFGERVDFALRLPPSFDPQLIGGRLCSLKGQPAALVFYQQPQSRISLFVLDGSDLKLPEDRLTVIDSKRCLLDARKGYSVVLWKERGLLYSLVSEAPSADLLHLAEKF